MSIIARFKNCFLQYSNGKSLYIYALCLMQALVGVISSNFRFVAISQRNDKSLLVSIVLEKESDEDMEEIEDLKTEFEALFPRQVNYDFDVKISSDPIKWTDRSAIVVFARREERGSLFDHR